MSSPAWPTLTLGELTESTRPICYGVLKPGREDPDGVPLVRVTDIALNEFDSRDLIRIAPDLDEEFARSRLEGGEVLISVQGTVGRVAIVPEAFAGSNVSRTIAVVAPDTRVDRRFLYWYLRWLGSRSAFETVGTTRDSLNIATLRRVQVPVPALDEQRRIADILDKADAILRKRKEAIALTEDLLRSAFLEMFGDPVTNPKGWPEVPLAELARITTGNTPSRAIPEYFGDEIEWIKSDNINTPSHFLTRAEEGLSAKGKAIGRIAPAGSSLVTCIAGSPECIGNVALADREVAFNQQINAVTPKAGIDHRFMYVLLLVGKRLVQAASTNSMKGMVSKGRLEEVLVPSPPKDLQTTFGRAFDAVLRATIRQEAALAESERLFQSALNRAFRPAEEAAC